MRLILELLKTLHPVLNFDWLGVLIYRLERDPKLQYRIHIVATWYWAANFPVVAFLFFGDPFLWIKVGLLLNTFYSLYANLSTDYSGASSALAAEQSEIKERLCRVESQSNEILKLLKNQQGTL